MDFNNQIAIVTGSANGIGAAVVKELVIRGVKPVLVDMYKHNELIAELDLKKDQYLEFNGDIRDEQFVINIVKETMEKYSQIHILVNNAGVGSRVSLLETTEEIWDLNMNTNMKATFFFTKHVIAESMLPNRYGRIINISSVSGINGGVVSQVTGESSGRSGPAYAASKGAIIAFTKWIAKEYGPHGITCNSVAPGGVETRLTKGFKYDFSQQPIKRMGLPEDIARAVTYFASPLSSFTTGEILKVDGGLHFG